jgi:hypothetical protein
MINRLHTLSVREQGAWMRCYHPSFKTEVTNRTLRSTGSLRPTSASRQYAVAIIYETGRQPAAYVDGLRARVADEQIPHTYAPDRPCLFYPMGREWRSDMMIATTIIPWLALWLYYYEVWLATGHWEGGGIPHEPSLDEGDVPNS